MKTYVALALLSLTLAACSQQATPAVHGVSSAIGTTAQGQTFANTQAAQEAQITAELKALGLDGGVSAQAVAPQVYLNVLPVPTSADSVRAYVKSTFTNPVTCSVTWGDGSASTSVASPTLGRIETQDHAYATFGTYTITVTCRNGASVVGTQSMTVQAGRKATAVVLDFENPFVPDGTFTQYYSGFQEKGYNFTIDSTNGLAHIGKGPLFGSFNAASSQTLLANDYEKSLIMESVVPLETFNLTSFDYERIDNRDMNVVLTGYKADNSIITLNLPNGGNQMRTFTLDSTWTNLVKVTWSNDLLNENWVMIDNINVSK